MIYIDSSVALAQLFNEDVRPPGSLWAESLVSSRLLEFELYHVIRVRALSPIHEQLARELLSRVGLLELIPEVIGPNRKAPAVRTLDALHLASAVFLIENGVSIQLASYDKRMLEGARKLRIPILHL